MIKSILFEFIHKKKIIVISIFLFFFMPYISYASDTNAKINWENNYIEASGYGLYPKNTHRYSTSGYLMARSAAIADAYSNLAEKAYEIDINSNTKLKDIIKKDKNFKTKINAIIKNAIIIKIKKSYPKVDAVVRVNINDIRINVFEQSNAKDYQNIFKTQPIPKENLKNIPEKKSSFNSAQKYTGIVIKVRAINPKPSLLPKIFDPDANIVYDFSIASYHIALNYGLVSYAFSFDKAINNKRAGNIPLIIEAYPVSLGSSDIVVNSHDARIIRELNKKYNLLKNCRVVIYYETTQSPL